MSLNLLFSGNLFALVLLDMTLGAFGWAFGSYFCFQKLKNQLKGWKLEAPFLEQLLLGSIVLKASCICFWLLAFCLLKW